MNLIPAIRNRCSCRKFRSEPVGEQELKLILEAATAAPSGQNRRDNRIYVIRNAEVLERLNDAIRICIAAGHADGIPKERASGAGGERYRFAYDAPVFLLITGEKDGYNTSANAGTLLENAMLQAAELGIGSCWINTVRRCASDAGVREVLMSLGFDPDRETVSGGLALGWPAEMLQPKTPDFGNEIIDIK